MQAQVCGTRVCVGMYRAGRCSHDTMAWDLAQPGCIWQGLRWRHHGCARHQLHVDAGAARGALHKRVVVHVKVVEDAEAHQRTQGGRPDVHGHAPAVEEQGSILACLQVLAALGNEQVDVGVAYIDCFRLHAKQQIQSLFDLGRIQLAHACSTCCVSKL